MNDITALKLAAIRAAAAISDYDRGRIDVLEKRLAVEEYEKLVSEPANVLALVEALEKAQKLATQQGNIACALFDEVTAQRQRIAELEGAEQKICAANVTLDARAELAERRPAEVEPRIVTAAASDVLAERQRQISAEGWSPEHDDEHVEGQIADAAACYALFATDQRRPVPAHWPWSDNWWKQRGQRRDLVRAGALIIAEIERIDRAAGIQVIEGEGQ